MWRDMERLCDKFALPWKRPTVFPRNSVLAARIAAAHSDQPWIEYFVRAVFHANFARNVELDEPVLRAILGDLGEDPDRCFDVTLNTAARTRLRENTERAVDLNIFGAPNCVVGNELFWGEEALEDAVAWTARSMSPRSANEALGDSEQAIAMTLSIGPSAPLGEG
jgi:2-hydroxychromene-2-carboxylate isomerase